MFQIVLRSFVQTFSVAGLNAISSALAWLIMALLVLAGLESVVSAYNFTSRTEDFILALILNLFSAFGFVITLVFSSYIAAPTSVLYGLLFQDRVARSVEAGSYPNDPAGQRVCGVVPLLRAIRTLAGLVLISVVFLGLSYAGGPPVGIAFYLVAAGALLGRDQFVAIASRYMPLAQARDVGQRNGWLVFSAGLAIAGFMLVPVLNLMMPVFSTILMIHLFRHLHASGQSDALPEQHEGAYARLFGQHRQGVLPPSS